MSFKLTIGKVVILGIDAYHNEAIISIFPRNDIDYIFRDYLKHILPFSAQHGKIYGAIKGNTLNKDSLSDLLVPLPPLAEQKRITEKIEQAFSVLDTIDSLQAQYADNLTALKAKLIDAAIQGKLTEQLTEDGTAEELYQQIQAKKQDLIKAGKAKKEKPLTEITADEIPFEIPENWKWVKLGSIMIRGHSTVRIGRRPHITTLNGEMVQHVWGTTTTSGTQV
jgi:type I restriction enzyme S subunit